MEGHSFIYRVKNERTGEIYIGATTKSLEERKEDHIQKALKGKRSGHKFQEAIRTYGPEAFSWEQVDTAVTSNELAEKEVQYILTYCSQEEGYNSDRGGGIKKNVYQYDTVTGNLIQFFEDLESAGNAVNADKTTISKACLGQIKACRGYFWSYSLGANFKPDPDRRTKEVYQFSFAGMFIERYASVAEASRETKVNKSSIAKCCRGNYRTAGDFFWSYKG